MANIISVRPCRSGPRMCAVTAEKANGAHKSRETRKLTIFLFAKKSCLSSLGRVEVILNISKHFCDNNGFIRAVKLLICHRTLVSKVCGYIFVNIYSYK